MNSRAERVRFISTGICIGTALAALCCLSSCASGGFTERKKETLPDGTVHEYDEPLPFWMQVATVAKWVLVGDRKPDPDQIVQHH
jgi:hypothetical protein